MSEAALTVGDVRIDCGQCLLIVGVRQTKTRLLRIIAGHRPAYGPRITVLDNQRPGSAATRSAVSFVHARSDLPRTYTVVQSIRWIARMRSPLARRAAHDELCAQLIKTFRIDERHAHAVPAAELDPQTRRTAALAMAFAGTVQLALLDDPLLGLDAEHAEIATEAIHAWRTDTGVAVAIGESSNTHGLPSAQLHEPLERRWHATMTIHVAHGPPPQDTAIC